MLRMYEYYAAGDADALLRLSSKEPGALAIGTDPDEWWEGYEPIARVTESFFAEVGGTVKIMTGELNAFEEGTTGWAADYARLRLPNGREVPIRVTVVFHLEGGDWRIVQQHSSIGVPNAELFG
jgi:ketosteroid isomerase-like protein